MKFRSSFAKYAVWISFCVPALHIIFRFLADSMSYGEVIHETGDWSVGFLVAALSVTPLEQIARKAGWLAFLRYNRRAIGVASFGYAALHTVVYLDRKWGADLIITEGLKPGMATGWVALLIFLVLAMTSNNFSIRRLGKSWKSLHRLVYVSALLVFAPWVLTGFGPNLAYISFVILCALEAIRWLPQRK